MCVWLEDFLEKLLAIPGSLYIKFARKEQTVILARVLKGKSDSANFAHRSGFKGEV